LSGHASECSTPGAEALHNTEETEMLFDTGHPMERSIALALIPLVFFSALGWGRWLERRLYTGTLGSSAYSVCLGLAIWVALGGLLNLAGWVRPLVLDLLILSGIGLAAWQLWRDRSRAGARLNLDIVPLLIVLAATLFFAWYLLPSSAFNHHDDFYKYLPRLERMLQTGTLAGNPFDYVGLDGLGMHTFLQGFFLAHLPVEYANGFDAVFCLMLGGLLLNDLGRRFQAHWLVRSAAVSAYLVINPQFTNVSPLYLGSALIPALLLASIALLDTQDDDNPGSRAKAAVPIGLFLAILVGAKITFVPYAATYLGLLLLALWLPGVGGTGRGRATLSILGTGTILVLSWLPLALSKVEEVLTLFWQKMERILDPLQAGNSLPEAQAAATTPAVPKLFTQILEREQLYYHGKFYQYGFLLLVIAAVTALAIGRCVRRPGARPLSLPLIGAGIAALLAFGVNIYFAPHADALVRYTTPLLLGTFPAIILFLSQGRKQPSGRTQEWGFRIAALAVPLATIALFAPQWSERIGQVAERREMLAWKHSLKYTSGIQALLSDRIGTHVRGIQRRIPEGAAFLAWVSVPFHFDFSRNTIFTLGSASRFRYIDRIPPEQKGAWLKRRLQAQGIRYVVWQLYGELPERSEQNKPLQSALTALMYSEPVLYQGDWVVFRLTEDP
jgi:hypothetical protein